MDPVGPWSAYAASYNRLANASSFQSASSTDLHHHMGSGVQAVPSSTSQLLAAHASSGLASSAASPFNPTGFLSPPPVGYDPVFTPLFHQKAHYGIQPRPIKQVEPDSYNQVTPNNFYDQNNAPSIPWTQSSPQLPSPFGILPHESVVPNSSSATSKSYDNFNAHFAAAQSLNQLNEYKNSSFSDPKKRTSSPPKASSTAPFFQQMFTTNLESNVQFKQNEYMSKSFQNGHNQSSCNVASPPSNSTNNKEYRIPQPPQRPQFPQQRNEKPRAYTPKQPSQKQPKLYETEKRNENESQSSPISYAMMDSQRGFQSTKMRSQQYQHIPNQQSYRFPMTPESDYQRSKSTESFGSSSSNPECNIGMPRRPSPLQAQPSPTIPTQSPVYPMYNSPLTTISSPSPVQHESCYNKQQSEVTPPLDVTISRNTISNSVITRIDSIYDRQDYNRQQWDDRRRYPGYENQNIQSRQQYYDPGNQVSLQDLSSCRGDPMSLVKNLQQQQPEKPADDVPKKRKKSIDKKADSDYVSRVPPPAHHNGNPANQNGYLDVDRWNLSSASNKMYSPPATFGAQPTDTTNLPNQPSSLVMPNPGPSNPYYPYNVPQPETPETTPETMETENPNQRKVIVPNIVEELQCLLDGSVSEETLYQKPLGPNPNEGFMSSFIKFLQGEKETSPSPDEMSPRPTKKKLYQTSDLSSENPSNTPIPEFPADPEDDPRYFPLPKSSDKRTFNSSDSDCSDHEISVDTLEKTEESSSMNNDQPHSSHKESRREKKKKRKKDKKLRKKKRSKRDESPEAVVPRRELSKRNAKKKSSYNLVEEIDVENHIPELHGSDSDPSWSQDEGSDDRTKRGRRISKRKKSKTSFKESTDEDEDEEDTEPKPLKRRISISASKKPSEKLSKKRPVVIIYPSKPSGKPNVFPYNVGEYVVMKSDTHLRHPPIWKVTEKTMLQKYLHFVDKGISYYQNLRFFTGWSPHNKYVYEGVIIKIIRINKQETVVELLSDDIHEMEADDRAVVEKIVNDTSTYSENFEIYIQALISQALDSNFLNEVFQEHDEYFLSNLKAIDSVVSDLEKRLCETVEWSDELVNAIRSFSGYKGQHKGGQNCSCCESPGIQVVTLSGVPYNKDTLEKDLLSGPSSHEVVLCRNCLTILEALHSLCHFKYSLYSLCEAKVNERREDDLEKDNSIILNEMLADEAWLSQLFIKVRKEWGYTESVIVKLKNPAPVQE